MSAAAGELSEFAGLVERYQGAVAAVAIAMTANTSGAEDIVQETFLRAWTRRTGLRDPLKARSWLCGIARNVAREHYRRGSREAGGDDLEKRLSSSADPERALLAAEEKDVISSVLNELPAPAREILVLYYWSERSVTDVAELLELSPDAVRQRLSRARRGLGSRVEAVFATAIRRVAPTTATGAAIIASIAARAGVAEAAVATASKSSGPALAWGAGALLASCLAVIAVSAQLPEGASSKAAVRSATRQSSTTSKPVPSPAAASVSAKERRLTRLLRLLGTDRPQTGDRSSGLPSRTAALANGGDPTRDFVAARELWKADRNDEAVPIFEGLIEAVPDSELAIYSANILLDIRVAGANESGEYGALIETSSSLLDNQLLLEGPDEGEEEQVAARRSGLRTTLERIDVTYLRRIAEEWEVADNWGQAALAYEVIVDRYPAAETLDEILFNLAVCAARAGNTTGAQAALASLAQRFPQSPLIGRAKATLAGL